MSYYIIIEVDSGLMVTEVPEESTAIAVAKEHGAVLIDEGPYRSYEAAADVMAAMPNPYEASKGLS